MSFRLKPGMPVLAITPDSIERLKSILAPWFKENARSATCIIHHLQESDGDAFVIRHGDTLKRVGVFDGDGKRDSHIFRPEQLDVANFTRMTGEWQVSGRGAKLQGVYREALGAVFHGSPHALAYSKRYSLEPLRDGPSALKCDIYSTVQFAELKSLKLEIPGGQQLTFNRPPVFEALNYTNAGLLSNAGLLEATIAFTILLPSASWVTPPLQAVASANRLSMLGLAEECGRSARRRSNEVPNIAAPVASPAARKKIKPALVIQPGWRWDMVRIVVAYGRILISCGGQHGEHVLPKTTAKKPNQALGILMQLAVDQEWSNPSSGASNHESVRKNFQRLESLLRALVPLPGKPFRNEAGKFIPCFKISLHPDLQEEHTRRSKR